MTEPTHIAALEVKDVKTIKAFYLKPEATGATIIGGDNKQGKTTVLDAIAWGLGGAKLAPNNPHREGALSDPYIKVTMSNGLVAERKGANGTLTVTDPTGKKGGQALLNAFVHEFALNLPKFMHSTSKEKATTLLQILGIGDQLKALDDQETTLYNERLVIGQNATSKTKHANELPEYPGTPDKQVSISELITQQQVVLAQNGENQRAREQVEYLATERDKAANRAQELERQLAMAQVGFEGYKSRHESASKSAEQLNDESMEELEAQILNFETINAHVAANQQKAQATDEANNLDLQYAAKQTAIEDVRLIRRALLDEADLPLPGLTIIEGELIYSGQPWDGMSGAERLQVAVAIVQKLQPNCGFVLLDELEKMDLTTLATFGAWLKKEGLQGIATRVSTGEECTIIIEDGLPQGQTYAETVTQVAPTPTEQEVGDGW